MGPFESAIRWCEDNKLSFRRIETLCQVGNGRMVKLLRKADSWDKPIILKLAEGFGIRADEFWKVGKLPVRVDLGKFRKRNRWDKK